MQTTTAPKAGNAPEAEALCDEVLARAPGHPRALALQEAIRSVRAESPR